VQVANTSDDAWRWRKVKQKDDRRDALKAARLSAVISCAKCTSRNQLREVYIPQTEVRQWRALITYRQHLVGRRTKIKNHIRDLLVREGQILARGSKCCNKLGQELLSSMARPLEEVGAAELWRGELWEELQQLQMIQERIASVEEKLNAMGAADARMRLLRTIPGVGPRLAEAIVA
jgi:transposase